MKAIRKLIRGKNDTDFSLWAFNQRYKADNNQEWLSKQSKEMQIDVLGQKKWNLWQKGKLFFRDMIDQRGNPLSIEELYQKAGVPLDKVV